jgi:hypothetical protein
MKTFWTYQKDEVSGKYFVTSNKTPPFGADICYGIKEEKEAALISAAAEMLAALKAFTGHSGFSVEEFERHNRDAFCHSGICSMEECGHCGRYLAAVRAVNKAEGKYDPKKP